MRRVLRAWLAAATLTAPAAAQSLNLDYGTGPTPTSEYAAAGVPGFWNTITSGPGELVPLHGLDGQPSAAAVSHNWGALLATDDPGTSGPDEALLDDGLGGFGDVAASVVFENLVNGSYEVTAYAWTPGQPTDSTLIIVQELRDGGQIAGGPWPGGLNAGRTHTVHQVRVTDGTLGIWVVGGFWGASGFLNGIQLRRVGSADLNGDGRVDIVDLNEVILSWGVCGEPCPADLDGDGVVGIADLIKVIQAWG